MKAPIGLSLLLAALSMARVAAKVTLPEAPPSPVPTIPSITENLWSGDVDDSPGGHGEMTIDFASGKFTMSDGKWEGGWRRRGAIRDFNQSSPDQVRFTLYIEATCVYGANARIEDGHLKGAYSGCSYATHNGGTFDLLPVASPTPSLTPAPTATPSPTPRPTRAPTPRPKRAPTPRPAERPATASPGALIAAMGNAEARYCKAAAQMACSYTKCKPGNASAWRSAPTLSTMSSPP